MNLTLIVIVAGLFVLFCGILLSVRMGGSGENKIKAFGMEFTLSSSALVIAVLGFLLVYFAMSGTHENAGNESGGASAPAATSASGAVVVPAGSQAAAAQTSSKAVEETRRKATTITVAYGGDPYACMLQLRMRIGDRSFVPSGSTYEVNDVELGRDTYTISGAIGCPGAGVCQATGNGIVSIEQGTTLQVLWQNTGIGQCSVALKEI